jgi:hypothetical protein
MRNSHNRAQFRTFPHISARFRTIPHISAHSAHFRTKVWWQDFVSPAAPCHDPDPALDTTNNSTMEKKKVSSKEMALSSEEEALLQRGLDWIGKTSGRAKSIKTRVKRFKSMYIEGPIAIHKLFSNCKQKMKKFKEKYAFMALMWLGK